MKEPIRIELPTFFGMRTVNSYLIKDPMPTLIDCGEDSDNTWESLITGLGEHGLNIRDIERLIITHAHVDHIGMAARVAHESGAKVWLNEATVDWGINVHENWHRRGEIMKHTMGKFFRPEMIKFMAAGFEDMNQKILSLWKPLRKEDVEVYAMDGKFQLDDHLWQILFLPGHSNTQTCFYNENSEHFISADMLLKITPTPVMEEDKENPGKREIGLLKMLDSYKKLQSLKISKVFPGHYEVFDNAEEVMQRQILRIQERKEQCFDLIKAGVCEIFQLYQGMYGEKWSFPAFNMLIGYLDLLEHEGRIQYDEEAGHKRILAASNA